MRCAFLLSDFGTADTYVAQMKAALAARLDEQVALVDVTHEIHPGDVRTGAFHLHVSLPRLPEGSGVLAIVDPGVGTARRAVLCRACGSWVCGPDNGLLGWLPVDDAYVLPPPPPGASRTFHGRDVFAPALAQAMSTGSPPVGALRAAPGSIASIARRDPLTKPGSIEVEVASVDRFGNVILWLREPDLRGLAPASAEVLGMVFDVRRGEVYGEGGDALILLEGSSGYMELALGGGSASGLTAAVPGTTVRLHLEDR